MPYKSAAQKHIEDLQTQLLERDRQIADLMNTQANAAVDESNKRAEAARAEAIAAEKEKARAAAWKWHNFETFAKTRPNDQLDFTAIDNVPNKGWPSETAEDDWNAGHPAEAAIAAASTASVADTRLGRLLKDMQDSHAHVENA